MITTLAGFIIGVLTTVGGAYGIVSHNLQLGAVSIFQVFQGGTGAGSFSPNSIITSGATATSPLTATSSNPLYIGSLVATTTATSTFAGGVSMTGLAISGNTGCAQFGAGGYLTGNTVNCGTGTVTSVDGSGGTTGLTLTGGPITTSGTLTLGGTLIVANGGTNNTVFAGSSIITSNSAGTQLIASSTGNLTVNGINATSTATSTFAGGLSGKSGVLISGYQSPGFTYATSTAWAGTTTLPLPSPFYNTLIDNTQCFTDAGTLNVDFYHTSTHLTMFNASTTQGLITFATNNTMTAGEKWYVDIGTPASSPTKITCAIKKESTSQ